MSRILAFAGSARRASLNRRLIHVAAAGARSAGAEVTIIDLAEFPLPLYDGDLEAAEGLPENVAPLKALFHDHAGLLLACPEYNSSITPLLKNTIDWVSRPAEGEAPLACFAGKHAALVAASPGALGGLRGLVVVRMLLGNIRMTVVPDQVAVPAAHTLFDDSGALTDEAMRDRVEGVGRALAMACRGASG
jgi:NAD(P)H-dependent FMN reductase